MRRDIVKLVPPEVRPGDALAQRLDDLALKIADELMGAEIGQKIDGLKALAGYWNMSRKGQSAPKEQPENAFSKYRDAQGAE